MNLRGTAAGGEVDDADEEAALRRLLLTQGDREDVARVVVERVVPRLARFLVVRFRALPEEDALDLAGTALTIALQRREQFKPGPEGRARTWLYGIAKRQALEFLRRRGSVVPLPAAENEPIGATSEFSSPSHYANLRCAHRLATVPSTDRSTLWHSVMEAVLDLPEQQRRATLDHYVDGIPAGEIDVRYGWKPNTAHVYLTHARAAVRQRLLLAERTSDDSGRLRVSD